MVDVKGCNNKSPPELQLTLTTCFLSWLNSSHLCLYHRAIRIPLAGQLPQNEAREIDMYQMNDPNHIMSKTDTCLFRTVSLGMDQGGAGRSQIGAKSRATNRAPNRAEGEEKTMGEPREGMPPAARPVATCAGRSNIEVRCAQQVGLTKSHHVSCTFRIETPECKILEVDIQF